jgi:hypothetical protein
MHVRTVGFPVIVIIIVQIIKYYALNSGWLIDYFLFASASFHRTILLPLTARGSTDAEIAS